MTYKKPVVGDVVNYTLTEKDKIDFNSKADVLPGIVKNVRVPNSPYPEVDVEISGVVGPDEKDVEIRVNIVTYGKEPGQYSWPE